MKIFDEKRLKILLPLLLAAPLVFFSYTASHELGHALVGLAAGGRVVGFSLGFNAHVSILSAQYTPFSEGLLHVAGALLPALLLIIVLFFYKSNAKSLLYRSFCYLFTAFVCGSLLVWVFMPIYSLFGTLPEGDDITKFLAATGIPPVFVAAAFAVVILFLLLFAVRKQVFNLFE